MIHYEDGLQRAVADWLDLQGWLWCHYPAGGKRNAREAARLKGMGVKAGVPDVMIYEPWEGGFGVVIELKRPKLGKRPAGTTTPMQREWLARLRQRGWRTAVCYTLDEVIEVCDSARLRR